MNLQLRKISLARYQNAVDNYEGWCRNCRRFTNYQVEPDAENYECEECGEDAVVGAENALVEGLFELLDEDLDSERDDEEDHDA